MTPSVRPEDLARFVPACLAGHLARRPGAGPSSAPAHAAVLFADISGFTALSEKLAADGAAGVERLTEVLNAYFGRIIEVVAGHGGDVVKFAGDALLAVWPVPAADDLRRVARLAAQSAMEVQTALTTFTSATGHRLSLRAGVGAGPISLVTVGGVFDRWELVVVGPPVVEATNAAAVAQPGEVVLGAAAWGHLPPSAAGTGAAGEFVRLDYMGERVAPEPLPPPAVPAAAVPGLLAFVPAAIHRRLAARQSGWLAELRPLTVLFVNLPGLTYKTPLDAAQRVMQALQTELYRFEGSVNKLSTDEKGVTFVAALGLPPLAHEDDPVRGTAAALAVHARLADLGWPVSVGVTTGRVFCGVIGSDRRCEFTVIGDTVNLSARLMQAAKGGVLADERTYRAARDRFDWEPLPAIALKGKAHPTPVFRPLRPARAVVGLKPAQGMVGRRAELDRLEAVADALVRDRAGGVVLIEGEAGIGKSTLVAHVLRIAHRRGLATAVGAALAIERSTPYFAWRAVVQQLLHLDPAAPADEQRGRVLGHLAFDPELVELAPLLEAVLPVGFPPTPRTAGMFGEERLSRTNALLVRLLARATEAAPLQLVLEDCHWLDSASWAVARQAAEEVPGLSLVLVTRPLPDPPPRDFPALAAGPTAVRLPLSPLSADESAALACRRLGAAELPPAVAALVQVKAQGNPFFVEELVYALRDAGKIRVRDGRCEAAAGEDLSALPFPDTVQGVVTSRIDRLAPPEQLTLKVASVIGRTFSKALLRDVSPIEDDKPHLDRHLDTLTASSLTTLDAPDPDPAYSFKHVITQEVSYSLLPPAQRQRLHQLVAEWYEGNRLAELPANFPLLAKHWSNADRSAKAVEYLEKAGENALRDCAHAEAVTFFEQAIARGADADRGRRAGWERRLAEAHYHLSDLATAGDHYRTALELLGYPSPRSAAGFALATPRELVTQLLHRLLPRRLVGQASGDTTARLEAARAYERLVQVRYLNNAKVPSLHAAYRALNLSERAGEGPELARNYAHAAVFSGLLTLHRAARNYAARARAMAERVDQPSCTAYVEFIRGVYWVTVGEWDAAVTDLSTAMTVTDRIGERRRWYESGFTLANALSRRGDLRASGELADRLLAAGRKRAVPQVRVWGAGWQAWCLLALDPDGPRLAELETELADCLAAHPTIPLADQILGYGILAGVRWRRGRHAEARAAADAADAILTRTNQIAHYLPPAYAGLAEVYAGVWAADPSAGPEMRRRLRRLIRTLWEFSLMYPIGRPTYELVRGGYELRRCRPGRAARRWRAAAAAAERFRMPYEEALAHAELARHLPPADARFPRDRARELFARAGAAADLQRLQADTND